MGINEVTELGFSVRRVLGSTLWDMDIVELGLMSCKILVTLKTKIKN